MLSTNPSSRSIAAAAYASSRQPSPLRILLIVAILWIVHSVTTNDYETELRDYLRTSKTLSEEDVEKMMPLSARDQQRAIRVKAESISNRLDRLEKNVDEIRVQLFGVNATGSISKVEK